MTSPISLRGNDARSVVSRVLVASLAVWVSFSAPAGGQNPELPISQLIDPASPDALQLHSGSEVREFYRYRASAPAWTNENQASEAIQLLRDSASDGLDPAVFRIGTILADRKADRTAAFDVLLTDAMLTYVDQISGSRVTPAKLGHFIALPPAQVPGPAILEGSLEANTTQSLPQKLAPPHPEYAQLKNALAQYRREGSKSARVAQIIANMERWRWLPRSFGTSYVEVNSADATLKFVKDNEIVFSTRLVTGKPSTPTPLFETAINAITVNPWWDIPGDIAFHELFPKQERHRGYFESHHIVGDRPGGGLRQMPGAGNPLGRFLMEMPNSFDAYLHDTPQKNLFEKSDRHLSHGCMRVENMEALASLVLGEGGDGSTDEMHSVLDTGETQTLSLSSPMPVYVLYWTVVPGANGSLAFHRDVYGWDSAVLAALNGR